MTLHAAGNYIAITHSRGKFHARIVDSAHQPARRVCAPAALQQREISLGSNALKFESFKIAPVKPATATGTVAAHPPSATPSPAKPAGAGLGAIANAASAANKQAAQAAAQSNEQRAKSQRVLLRVKANIHVALQGKQSTIEATTLSVYNQGATIVLKQGLPTSTKLVLEHLGTKEKIACRVSKASREMPEGFHIPLEFDTPAPNFWGIAFPPADWKPHDDM